MVRQARSEATRRKIIDSAVELINEIGYPASGLADIIERAELTKGALYYHFESKEAVATAIIEEGADRILGAFRSAGRSVPPRWRTSSTAGSSSPMPSRTTASRRRRVGYCARSADSTPRRRRRTESRSRARRARELRRRRRATSGPTSMPMPSSRRSSPSMLGAELVSSAMTDGRDLRRRSPAPWRSCYLRSSPRSRSGTTANSSPVSRCATRRLTRNRHRSPTHDPSDHSRSVRS